MGGIVSIAYRSFKKTNNRNLDYMLCKADQELENEYTYDSDCSVT